MTSPANSLLAPTSAIALMQASQNDTAASAKKIRDSKDLAKVEQTATEFEGMYIAEMLKPMFEGLETDGLFGGGKGEEIFRGILIQEYGKEMSRSGGIGLSSQIREAMILMQEQADNATSQAQQ